MEILLARYLMIQKNISLILLTLICVLVVSVQSVKAQTSFTIPNVFTPNNDNINDEFVIKPTGITVTDFSIKIFNRWGALLFSSQNMNISWDGRTAAGVKVPEGNYYYVVTLNDTDYKGVVSLIY